MDITNDFDKCKEYFSACWHEICEFLYAHKIGYNYDYSQFNELCEKDEFFGAFKRVFIAGENSLQLQAKDIRKLRRFVYETDNNKIKVDRFIPKIEFAQLNRMNDDDRVYNYLVSDLGDLPNHQIIKTGLMEIRANSRTNVWSCEFNIKPAYKDRKIINLSSKYRLPIEEHEFTSLLYRKYKEAYYNSGKTAGEQVVEYYTVQLFIMMIEASDVFTPIDKEQSDTEQRKKYKPFHFLCNYYESKGYIGLLFRSTVNKCGVNLVLFDPKYADCDFSTCNHLGLGN